MKNKINFKTLAFFIEGVLCLSLIIGLFSFSFAANPAQNVTVPTLFEVGNSFPEVPMVRINEGSAINLVANQTKTVSCVAVIRDYNGENDTTSANAVFFDNVASSSGAVDDNNKHYSNSSCALNINFGTYNSYTDDEYSTLANCTFDVWYYANAQSWNCTVTANDTAGGQGFNSSIQTVSQLLSLFLPESINYGLVNATSVSDQQIANVTNVGNVQVNLSLEGYAVSPHDGFAMNCTYGATKNISVMYEKYNLTEGTTGSIPTLAEFEQKYVNLTTNAVTKAFRLPYRQDDINQFLDDTNSTYWRIYIPRGVAGNCTGNIIFGATVAAGS